MTVRDEEAAPPAGGTGPQGLAEADAADLLARLGPNEVAEALPMRLPARVVNQLRDPMIMLLLAAGALAVALRDGTDAVVIASVVVLNTAVGVAQELRAERALAALRRIAAPMATVLRDGARTRRPSREVVPGDTILLEAGDVVPADARLLDAVRLQVDEAALTGESVPVDKEPPADEVLAGTVVTRGRATAVVERTGQASALGRIAALLAGTRPRPTPLQRRLAGLGRALTAVALGVSGLVLLIGLAQDRPAGEMVLTAVSLAVAAVPESLPAVATVGLALGARRMARRSAVVRHLPAVETLGSVTLVAADKTGTLTEGRMLAERVWTPWDGLLSVTGSGYAPDGAVLDAGGERRAKPSPVLAALLRDVVLCNDADIEPDPAVPGRRAWRALGDPTEAALVALAAKGGVLAHPVREGHPRVGEIPFTSENASMTTLHATVDPDLWLTVRKGAPERILGGLEGLDPDAAREAAATLGAAGYRVLAVTHRLGPRPADLADPRGLVLAGLVGITDPPRAQAPRVVDAFRAAGIGVVMITGDHPDTAGAVAARVGLPAGAVRTGTELAEGLTDEQLDATRVFARIRPEQKLDIVQSLQGRGHVVAMTGDGVNDAPALRAADIGVAMGSGGTEVARQAADLVLTDDDLGTVVEAVAEGRRIYTNIRTFLGYALAGGLAEVLVMLLGPAGGLGVPLLPAQILWINMLTHGLPGVAMGAEPRTPGDLTRGPRPPREPVLGDGLWWRIAWSGCLIAAVSLALGAWAHASGGPGQSVVFAALGFAQLGVALALRRPARTVRFLDVAVLAASVAHVTALTWEPLREALGLATLSGTQWAAVAVAALAPAAAVRAAEYRRAQCATST